MLVRARAQRLRRSLMILGLIALGYLSLMAVAMFPGREALSPQPPSPPFSGGAVEA